MSPESTHSEPSRPRQRTAALLLAAVAGAAVMVIELGVARILTPVFGGSITVWAFVIATTMLALAAGYAFGGYRADVTGGIIVARRAAVLGALLCAAIPFIRVPLIEATIDLSTLTGAAIAALVFIAPPLFFLSQVSPALIRGLSSEGISHVGGTAGGIYAISTVGSLIGTLAAVWIFLYTPMTLAFLGTALLTIAPVLLLRVPLASAAMLVVVILLATSLGGETEAVSADNAHGKSYRLVDKRHTLYGELRVVEQGGADRFMIVNGFDQGGIDIDSGLSTYDYDDGLIGLARLYAANIDSALIIGLGPGVMAETLAREGVAVDAVEIDAEVVRAAREYFGYRGDAVVGDGRRFLQRSDQTWDVIFVDAFLGGSPPWQLYTEEAFALYRAHLNAGGVAVLNVVGSHLDAEQRPALEAVVATAREVFSSVDVYPDPWEPDDYPTRNIFIAASDQPRIVPRQAGKPGDADRLSQALARSEPIAVETGRVLTDDAAPLEVLVRRTTEILRSRAREYLPLSVIIE
jgi:spermidine synthase